MVYFFVLINQIITVCSQRNFPISFKPKVAIAKFVWKMQKKVWYYEKWVDAMPLFLLDDLLSKYLLTRSSLTALGKNLKCRLVYKTLILEQTCFCLFMLIWKLRRDLLEGHKLFTRSRSSPFCLFFNSCCCCFTLSIRQS
jgi:hypothetical protein